MQFFHFHNPFLWLIITGFSIALLLAKGKVDKIYSTLAVISLGVALYLAIKGDNKYVSEVLSFFRGK